MSENYLGNPNLKKSNITVNFTKKQIEEYMNCMRDPVYFIEKYVKIVNIDKGLVKFRLYDYQQEMVETFAGNRFVINKLPRQTGKSTTVTAFMLWNILFNDQQSIAILANKGSLARELLGKIQIAYEHLPKWLQQGVVVWNKGNIELENGSKILAASTSASAVRGGSFNLIFLDEFAFVPQNMAEDFFASVYPTVTSGKTSKVIIVSTPNGMNHFYKMWSDAVERRSLYVPVDVHWTQVPGRDEKWKEETIKNTSEEQFRQEFECEFIGSSHTLINAAKLAAIPYKEPLKKVNDVEYFEKPAEQRTYVVTVDVARGVGNDYSAFTVFDVSQIPYRQVAKYKNNMINPMVFPNVIHQIAKSYNDAYVLVEINDIGGQVADALYNDLEYENMLSTTPMGRGGQQLGAGFGKNAQLGIRTTKSVKKIGCSNLKTLIENDQLIINDFDTVAELSSFTQRGGSYEAEAGHHDDLVMTCVLFAWLSSQQYFKELTDLDVRQKLAREHEESMDHEMLPFGIINDGLEEESIVDAGGDRWFTI